MEVFHRRLEASESYGIGNCGEQASVALDFLSRGFSAINAEQFEIPGLDHTFVILGRKKGSKLSDPSTWGNNGVVCDPWSGKVFKALPYETQFEKHMKGFRSRRNPTDGRFHDREISFSSLIHHIKRVGKEFTSEFIQKHRRRHLNQIVSIFTKRMDSLQYATSEYLSTLESTHKRLLEKYGEDNSKVAILDEKIKAMRPILARISLASSREAVAGGYREARKALEAELRTAFQAVSDTMRFSREEKRELATHQATDDFKQRMNAALGLSPKSMASISKAEEKLGNALEELIKPPRPGM